MKKNGRKSKNLEVQTEKQRKAAEKGLDLQERAYANEVLKDPTPIRKQGLSEDGKLFAALTNPGAVTSRMAAAGKLKDATKSPAERRGKKDPKAQLLKKGGDFKFFTHKTKGK